MDYKEQKAKGANMTEPEHTKKVKESSLWAVLKVFPWRAIIFQNKHTKIDLGTIMKVEDGPPAFLPVFHSKEQAVAWNDGCEDNVIELESIRNGPGAADPEK